MTSRLELAWGLVRRNGLGIGVEVLVNGVAPWAIYTLEHKSLGDVGALLASSIPPIAWSLLEFLRRRRVDAISILALAGIALSLIAFIGTGGAKFLQLRETLVGGVVGLMFLGSVLIRRPLIYYLALASTLRRDAAGAEELKGLRGNVYFERTMTTMTLAWGLGLLAHTSVNVALVFALSIQTYLAVAPIGGYAFAGLMVGWTFWYVRRARAAGAARRAAAQADQSASDSPSAQPVTGAAS
ncbi:MAG TPA: VC0807 family protein [Caulobacteraceae bacterium]|nr:VC0807 family protein [Caulobacteraceae bacterium]